MGDAGISKHRTYSSDITSYIFSDFHLGTWLNAIAQTRAAAPACQLLRSHLRLLRSRTAHGHVQLSFDPVDNISDWCDGKCANTSIAALPYAYDALAPFISERTLVFHHDKHHAKYVANVNSMIDAESPLFGKEVTDVMAASYQINQSLYNNAAQSYNHEFFWRSMKPGGGGKPSEGLLKKIENKFVSFEKFRSEFIASGMSVFGSGWVWLVWTQHGLQIVSTMGADCPLNTNLSQTPLLVMDVWEHAYYLDYQNLRQSFCEAFVDHLINWEFVESRIPSSSAQEL